MAQSPESRILRVFRLQDEPLSATHYLAEYEAIIVKPVWERLLSTGRTVGEILQSEADFNRKSVELGEFLDAGGLLVILAVPVETHLFQSMASQNNQSWWARHAEPLRASPEMVIPGSGTSVMPTGSGSEFDEYLGYLTTYQARLSSWFDDQDNVRILARNRTGGTIAAEISVGPGMIVCVPPPADPRGEALLLKAVADFLGHRFGPGLGWPLPEEDDLARARLQLVGEFHAAMAEITAKQRVVQERKRAVFGKSQVRRGVGYYEQATRPGSTPKQIMTALYDLIEMLRDYYDTDWDGLGDALGVSHNSIDRIKRLANKRELHLRHTTADDPEGVDQTDLDKAAADGKAILSAFIAREYEEEVAKTPTTS